VKIARTLSYRPAGCGPPAAQQGAGQEQVKNFLSSEKNILHFFRRLAMISDCQGGGAGQPGESGSSEYWLAHRRDGKREVDEEGFSDRDLKQVGRR